MPDALSPNFASPLAYLRNKEVWHLPRCKVTTAAHLLPMHDILIIPLAPFFRTIAISTREPTHAYRHVDRPRGRVDLALPVVTRRRSPRIRKPVQHNRVEHLIFAERRLHISFVMGPVS